MYSQSHACRKMPQCSSSHTSGLSFEWMASYKLGLISQGQCSTVSRSQASVSFASQPGPCQTPWLSAQPMCKHSQKYNGIRLTFPSPSCALFLHISQPCLSFSIYPLEYHSQKDMLCPSLLSLSTRQSPTHFPQSPSFFHSSSKAFTIPYPLLPSVLGLFSVFFL